jgi:hypothetical protein
MNGWLAREARFLNTNLELFKQFWCAGKTGKE